MCDDGCRKKKSASRVEVDSRWAKDGAQLGDFGPLGL